VSAALAEPVVITCQRCGFDFEHRRARRSGPPKRLCGDCVKRRHREHQAAYIADAPLPPLEGADNPAYPLLVRFVDHQCGVRLALACLRTGRYDEAAQALTALDHP
jgi:hypothetical protein